MKRFGMMGVVWWFVILLAAEGCGKRALVKDPAATAARGQAAALTIKDDAGRAKP